MKLKLSVNYQEPSFSKLHSIQKISKSALVERNNAPTVGAPFISLCQ